MQRTMGGTATTADGGRSWPSRGRAWLRANADVALAVSIVVAATSCYVLWLFGPEYLAGSGPYWEWPKADQGSHLIGLRYFYADEWRWPLLDVSGLGGANLYVTDAVPWLAIAAKLLRPLLGDPAANYFGAFVGLCYVLGAASMVALLHGCGVRSRPLLIGAGLLVPMLPPLMMRYYTVNLHAHFLIVAGLATYLALKRGAGGRGAAAATVLLPALAIGIHPYLFVMALGLVLVGLAQGAVDRALRPRKAALMAAVSVGLSAAIYLAFGVGDRSGGQVEGPGYGNYGLNLLAPFIKDPAGLPVGQVEGYLYLGAGCLAWLAYAFVTGRRHLLPLLRRNALLGTALAGVWVLALSNEIYWGKAHLLSVPLPASVSALLGTFRSSGRFAWLILYVALAAAFLVAPRTRVSLLVLTCALGLQLADTSYHRQVVAADAASGEPPRVTAASWRPMVESAERLLLVPSYLCLFVRASRGDLPPAEHGQLEKAWRDLHVIAARTLVPTNSFRAARAEVDCDAEPEAVLRQARPRDLLVLPERFTAPPALAARLECAAPIDGLRPCRVVR